MRVHRITQNYTLGLELLADRRFDLGDLQRSDSVTALYIAPIYRRMCAWTRSVARSSSPILGL